MRLSYKYLWKVYIGKLYGRYGDIIKQYEVLLSLMLREILGHDDM